MKQPERVAARLAQDSRDAWAERIARANAVLAMSDDELAADFVATDARFHRGHQAWSGVDAPEPLPAFRERRARVRCWARLLLAHEGGGSEAEAEAAIKYEEERTT